MTLIQRFVVRRLNFVHSGLHIYIVISYATRQAVTECTHLPRDPGANPDRQNLMDCFLARDTNIL